MKVRTLIASFLLIGCVALEIHLSIGFMQSRNASATRATSAISSATASCAGTTFCDGFENQTGTTPSGVWQLNFPNNCHGTGTATIDRTVAHSGTASVRIDGHAGYCNHVFVSAQNAFTGNRDDLYVRFFMRQTVALSPSHITYVAMHDAHDGVNNDLRLGGQKGAMEWNRQSDDATLPVESTVGVALSQPLVVNQWQCIEFEVNKPQRSIRTWLNGSEVQGLHLDRIPTPELDANWIKGVPNWHPSLTDLRFGWETYTNGYDNTLWFDDVAVSTHMIGCA